MKHDPKNLDAVEPGAALPLTPVLLAIEELKAMAQDEEFLERYESRRRYLLECNVATKVALKQGEKIGRIHACERLLDLPETPIEQLMALSWEVLSHLAEDLHGQVATTTKHSLEPR